MGKVLHLHKDELTTAGHIEQTCDELKELLLKKNAQYGDSALNPIRICSQASTIEQLKVRLDDKLSRISRGNNQIESEDVILDLLGYFLLLLIATRNA